MPPISSKEITIVTWKSVRHRLKSLYRQDWSETVEGSTMQKGDDDAGANGRARTCNIAYALY